MKCRRSNLCTDRSWLRWLRLGLGLWLLCFFSAHLQAGDPPRLVALGDVHGDLDSMLAILQKAGVIDGNRNWSGGNAKLVLVGDFLDRGPKNRQVMDFLMALEEEAPRHNGELVALLGNHEVMNLMGDLRYVESWDYASFATDDSESHLQAAYQDYVSLAHQNARELRRSLPDFTPEFKQKWLAEHPPGFLEHREAFSPDGKYGSWLRKKPAAAQINGIIFMHGGIHPQFGSMKVKDINSHIGSEIERFDSLVNYLARRGVILPFFTFQEILEAARAVVEGVSTGRYDAFGWDQRNLQALESLFRPGQWWSLHPDGPLWFRGFSGWSEEEGSRHVDRILKANKASHLVVGHTVQYNSGLGTIRPRFDGKVFLIDTGMLFTYFRGGRPSALEIQNGRFTAIYLDRRQLLGKYGKKELFSTALKGRHSIAQGKRSAALGFATRRATCPEGAVQTGQRLVLPFQGKFQPGTETQGCAALALGYRMPPFQGGAE